MNCKLTLGKLAQIINCQFSTLTPKDELQCVNGIVTDSRTLVSGEVFVALQGENFDGHNFLDQAETKGAIALIVSQESTIKSTTSIPQLQVEDTLVAYQQIAHWWRNQFDIPIIGITGSVGKTTTKELIAAVLSSQGQVLKTQANYNNEIGVPKTLFGLTPQADYGVIEMAMRGKGEIALLADIARPTIGLITNVGTAHIGRLGSREAIAQAKCELLGHMPSTSVAILNHDNPLLLSTAKQVWQGETVTFGLEGGDIQGELIDSHTLRVEGQDFPLPLPGKHNASNYLAALAVAKVLGIDWTQFMAGVAVTMPKGRSQRYDLEDDIVVLDETYNAGYESMVAALQLLKETPGKRHIAILGTMKELGEKATQLHQQVGEAATELHLDSLLVLVDDPDAQGIVTGAQGISTESFATREEILTRLKTVVQPGDRLLFKASNSVGLSKLVQDFCSMASGVRE